LNLFSLACLFAFVASTVKVEFLFIIYFNFFLQINLKKMANATGNWKCSKCQYDNPASMSKCAMCDSSPMVNNQQPPPYNNQQNSQGQGQQQQYPPQQQQQYHPPQQQQQQQYSPQQQQQSVYFFSCMATPPMHR